MMNLDDLLEHYAEEFNHIGNFLKKLSYAPNYRSYLDSNNVKNTINNEAELKKYLQQEINELQLAINELKENESI